MGSEPGVGWNTVQALAKYHQVWVLTREDNRTSIEAELTNNNYISKIKFVYVDLPGSKWWKRGIGGVHLHNYIWQIKAYLVARKLHSNISFDLAHHITYVRYSSPSFLSLLPIPFIWGPVGGGESAPKAFWEDFSLRGKIYEYARNLLRWLGEKDPFVRMTARRSILAWGTTNDTSQRLHKIGAKNVQVCSQLGISQEELAKLANYTISDNLPLRFISVGRLLHWKGFDLGLKAFAQANLPDCEYWIVGEGLEKQRLEMIAQQLGIAQQVKFWGNLSREQTLSKIGNCHVLVHPSLHESGGFVCLEAMAAGRPVICLDLGGPAVQVTEETGFKVPANTPTQAIHDLAEVMACLAKDSELRVRMGQVGQKRVAQFFNWDMKAKSLTQLYETIIHDNDYSGKALA
jgi:glycosyltransferase involved in cell wall biosynthesis